MILRKITLFSLLLTTGAVMADDQDVIRINQIGYFSQQEKVLVVDNIKPKSIVLMNEAGKKVAKLRPTRSAVSPFTGKTRYVVDFSKVVSPGQYVVDVDGRQTPVLVSDHPLKDLAKASVQAFYMMRSGMEIESSLAGKYARPLGHPDIQVMIHPSAASPMRPAGMVIASPYGWYDAGDYNKYIVNSAFTIGMMLAVYEQIPDYFASLKLDIPERDNATPDLLDEIMYNIKWMFTMQDPYDGGVYHKLTTPNFEGFVMPADCHQQRYVVQKSVTATLDFAAVMAQASRLFKGSPDYPGLSEQMLKAAEAAFAWAKEHPDAFYRQGMMNQRFQPAVNTGEYGDGFAKDEWFWAATQLALATGKTAYHDLALSNMPERFAVPVWGMLSGLGVYAWLASTDAAMADKCKELLKAYADQALQNTATSNFMAPFGDKPTDFGWGCLAESFCSPAVALLFADRFIQSGKYRKDALRSLDYVLGRNPLGYCYVTGFGQKSPLRPHQRLSAADGVDAPMPGLLVGGPNPGQQDKGSGLKYASSAPDESYLDLAESYASNEIAINWNASLVAVVCWLDALM